MTGIDSIFAMALLPYWPTIERNKSNVVYINEKVFATQRSDETPSFFERGGAKAVRLDDAIELCKNDLRGQGLLGQAMAARMRAQRPTTVSGIDGNRKIGFGLLSLDEIKPLILHDSVKELPVGGNALVPIAWIGEENKVILLPLPPTLSAKYFDSGYGGQWDYSHRTAIPSSIHANLAVGHVENRFAAPATKHTAAVWDLENMTARNIQPAWAESSLASWIDGDFAVGYAFQGGTCFAVLWNVKSNEVKRLRSNAKAAFVRNDIQVGHTISTTSTRNRAALWKGSVDSYVDLHQGIPTDITRTNACWVGESGTIFGTGFTRSGTRVGIEWKPNPLWNRSE